MLWYIKSVDNRVHDTKKLNQVMLSTNGIQTYDFNIMHAQTADSGGRLDDLRLWMD